MKRYKGFLFVTVAVLWAAGAGCYRTTADKDQPGPDGGELQADSSEEGDSSGEEDSSGEDVEYRYGIFAIEGWTWTSDMAAVTELINDIENIDLSGEPIVSTVDIISYDWKTNEMKLRHETIARFEEIGLLPMYTEPLPVVVVANDERIFIAVFWPLVFSSIPLVPMVDLYTEDENAFLQIWRPPLHADDEILENMLKINDPRIRDALEQADLLI